MTIVDVLILNKFLLQIVVNMMRLMRIHCPSVLKFKILLCFQLMPIAFFHHELTSNFIPALLPIYSSVKYHHYYIIYSYIASNKPKPAILHCSKFILILNQAIIIKLILVKRSLKIKLYLISWP
jgi:hypothetical protein